MGISRRTLLLLGTGVTALVGVRLALPWLWRAGPVRPLDPELQRFVDECFEGLDRTRMVDTHVHVVGLGRGGSGCWVNPEMLSHLHPWKRLQFELYLAGAGIDADDAEADARYIERLLELQAAANPQGRLLAMAFDWHVREDGSEDRDNSTFHTPNEYVLDLARRHSSLLACASVHPYRHDAIDQLDAAVEGGAVAVKWLPNAMGIDPASPRCDRFYARLADLGIPLITHGGKESAVDAGELQALGNPQRVRRALDAGVTVVLAHCGSLGSSTDLDQPEASRKTRDNFELFLRLFSERQYASSLYADISAVTFVNRAGHVLRELLAAPELHGRLVNGSDYPVVAVDPVLSTRQLVGNEVLDAQDKGLCEAVFAANPLLFDFVVKRRLRLAQGGQVHRFADSVFQTARMFEGRA